MQKNLRSQWDILMLKSGTFILLFVIAWSHAIYIKPYNNKKTHCILQVVVL